MNSQEIKQIFNLEYSINDYSFSFVLHAKKDAQAVGYCLSFRDKMFTAREYTRSRLPPFRWEPKEGCSMEKYYVKDYEFGDICQLEVMLNNLTRFLGHDVIEFDQKFFSENSRRELLNEIIRDAFRRNLYELNRLPVPDALRSTAADGSSDSQQSSGGAASYSSAGPAASAAAGSTGSSDFSRTAAQRKADPAAFRSSPDISAAAAGNVIKNDHREEEEKEDLLEYFLSFDGTMNRRKFIFHMLKTYLLVTLVFIVSVVILTHEDQNGKMLIHDEDGSLTAITLLIEFIFLFVATCSFCTRRGRDAGFGSWTLALLFITPINLLYLGALLIFPSKEQNTAGSENYNGRSSFSGPEPEQEEPDDADNDDLSDYDDDPDNYDEECDDEDQDDCDEDDEKLRGDVDLYDEDANEDGRRS